LLLEVAPTVFIDLKGSLDGEKSIADQMLNEKRPICIVLSDPQAIVTLPDCPEELKDYIKEPIVPEKE
jgi:hypothetical protein